jgi:hypothetical protein
LSGEPDNGYCEAPLPAEEKEMLGIYEGLFFIGKLCQKYFL